MNIKKISYITLALMAVGAISCTYDEKNEIDGQGLRRVRIETAAGSLGLNMQLVAFDPIVETKTIAVINRDAISQADLQTQVTVDFTVLDSVASIAQLHELNQALLADAELDTLFLPGEDPIDSFYVLPKKFWNVGVEGSPATSITFAPGDAVHEITMDLDPTLGFDYSTKYVVLLQLSNISAPYTISNSLGFSFIQIVVKNAYDGNYGTDGTRYNFTNAASYTGWDDATDTPGGYAAVQSTWNYDTPIATVDQNTVTVHAGQPNFPSSFGTIDLTVNDDNTVDIAPNATTGLPEIKELADKKSTYDPVKHQFHIYYSWTNADGGHRVVDEVLTYKGSR